MNVKYLESQISKNEKPLPSPNSVFGLNWLLFCISDIRHGIGPLLAIHLKSTLKWDSGKIGFILAAVEFSAFLAQIPAGLLADYTKSKRSLISVSCLLIILGCFIFISSSLLYPILIAQITLGLAVSLISPALGSITMGLFGRKKFPERAAKNEVWNHLGNVTCAALAGLTGYFFGTTYIFFLLIGFALGSLVFLSFIRPKEIDYSKARELPETSNVTPIYVLLKKKGVIIFNISLIIYYIANGAQISLLGQILANKDPFYSSLFISASMIVAEVTMIAIAFLMSFIVNKFNRKTFFIIAFIMLPLRATLFSFVENTYLLLLIQVLDGVAAGILGTIGGVINSDLAAKTGRFNFLQGVGAMSNSIGESISQLFAGFIAVMFGFHFSFFTLALVGFVGVFFFGFFMPETKPIEIPEA